MRLNQNKKFIDRVCFVQIAKLTQKEKSIIGDRLRD